MKASLRGAVSLRGSGSLAAYPEMSRSYFSQLCDHLCLYIVTLLHGIATHALNDMQKLDTSIACL